MPNRPAAVGPSLTCKPLRHKLIAPVARVRRQHGHQVRRVQFFPCPCVGSGKGGSDGLVKDVGARTEVGHSAPVLSYRCCGIQAALPLLLVDTECQRQQSQLVFDVGAAFQVHQKGVACGQLGCGLPSTCVHGWDAHHGFRARRGRAQPRQKYREQGILWNLCWRASGWAWQGQPSTRCSLGVREGRAKFDKVGSASTAPPPGWDRAASWWHHFKTPPQPPPVSGLVASGCNCVSTKLRGARMTFSAASMTSRSVAPSATSAIRSGSDIRHRSQVAHHP